MGIATAIALACAILALTAIALMIRVSIAVSQQKEQKIDPITKIEDIDQVLAADHLSSAIACRTTSFSSVQDPVRTEFAKLRDLLQASFPLIHTMLEQRTIGEDNLVFVWHGTDAKLEPVLLCAHQDVVPAHPDGWTHDPFDKTIADGYVWGRGSFDMKGQLIVMLEAVELLLRQQHTPRRSIWIALGCDEELRGDVGAKMVATALQAEQRRFAFVLDEGGAVLEGFFPLVAKPVAVIGVAEKTYVDVKLTCSGHGGHSSTPDNPTPLARVARAIDRLERSRRPVRLTAPIVAMLKTLALHSPVALAWVLYHPRLFACVLAKILDKQNSTRALIHDTAAATMAQGSDASNVIGSTASAIVNFRLLPGSTEQALKTWIDRTIADPQVQASVMKSYPSSVPADLGSIGYDLVRQAALASYGDVAVSPYLMTGGTDALWYEGLSTCVLRFSPFSMDRNELSRMHGRDERLSLDNLASGIHFYCELLARL